MVDAVAKEVEGWKVDLGVLPRRPAAAEGPREGKCYLGAGGSVSVPYPKEASGARRRRGTCMSAGAPDEAPASGRLGTSVRNGSVTPPCFLQQQAYGRWAG